MMNKSLDTPLLKDPTKTGILLVNKPQGNTSFSLIGCLRRLSGIRTIGHAGTLDPFATGVMILLIGKEYTRLSNNFLNLDKEYRARLFLGETTTTFDPEGPVTSTSPLIPSLAQVEEALTAFQGTVMQTPPMFSAKKVKGVALYKLARKGKVIERAPVPVTLKTTLLSYDYPYLELTISCSKGTYIRSIAHDLGQTLGCGAYLKELVRTRCGPYTLERCIDGMLLLGDKIDYTETLIRDVHV